MIQDYDRGDGVFVDAEIQKSVPRQKVVGNVNGFAILPGGKLLDVGELIEEVQHLKNEVHRLNLGRKQPIVTDAMLRIIVHQARRVARTVPDCAVMDFEAGAEIVVSILKRRLGLSNWICEDQLPDGYDYDGNYSKSKIVDGVRMFPR